MPVLACGRADETTRGLAHVAVALFFILFVKMALVSAVGCIVRWYLHSCRTGCECGFPRGGCEAVGKGRQDRRHQGSTDDIGVVGTSWMYVP